MDPHRRVNSAGAHIEPHFELLSRVHPRALIVITAYNEDHELLSGTLRSVLANLASLQASQQTNAAQPYDRRLAAAAREMTPEEIVCLVVFDGREKIHKSHFSGDGIFSAEDSARMLAALQDVPKREAGDEVRDLHLFESQYAPESSRGVPSPVSLNLLLAIKEENGGKLNSHAWAFRALAPFLGPEFLMLLDAGTKPAPTACLRLFGTLILDERVGGCCGEICVDHGQRSLLAPVVMAQVFEYTSANAIDKAFESAIGFISVLPGAFSAYRIAAIDGEPLASYFKLEDKKEAAKLSTGVANMYLAEDRILGFEIVAKAGHAWRLAYDAGSAAFTDVPDSVGNLVKQRRRWLNGSFFATIYAIYHWARLLPGGGTSHALWQQALFLFQLLYHCINVFLAWFTLGNCYFSLRLIVDSSKPISEGVSGAVIAQGFATLTVVWQLLHVYLIVWSLGNKAEDSLGLWSLAAVFFGLCGLGAFVLIASKIVVSSVFVWVSGLGVLIVYAFCCCLQGQLFPVVLSAFHYTACLPLFNILIPIYSWSNTHDLSWGTRPSTADPAAAAAAAATVRTNAEFRSRVLAAWITCNWVLAQALSQSAGLGSSSSVGFESPALYWYGIAIGGLLAFSLGARIVGCLFFVIFEGISFWYAVAVRPLSPQKGDSTLSSATAPRGNPLTFDSSRARPDIWSVNPMTRELSLVASKRRLVVPQPTRKS